MRKSDLRLCGLAAGIVIAAVANITPGVSLFGTQGYALAASASDKAKGRSDLEQVIKSLQAVDVAYAAGNTAEAQARYADAVAGWKRIAPMISAREAREQQLLFDALGNQLRTSVPATQIKSTVTGMLDELHDDIEAELK